MLIPSSKVATFDMKPEMSAYEITDKAVELINEKKYDVMILTSPTAIWWATPA